MRRRGDSPSPSLASRRARPGAKTRSLARRPARRNRGPRGSPARTGARAAGPEQASAGFARKHGVAVPELGRRDTPKGPVVVARVKAKGAVLGEMLAAQVDAALKALPIAKLMRWGAGDAQFVRPVHGLVMLHGEEVVPGEVLGLRSGRITTGHRFLGEGSITLARADEYEARLQTAGRVVASFAARRGEIDRQLKVAALGEKGSLGGYAD